jgi:phosphoenolpyruvate carboxykinase (GTP)
VLTWIIGRLEGTKDAVESPIGYVPTPDSLDTEGLDVDRAALERVLSVDVEEWRREVALIEEWFATIGEKTPTTLMGELDGLKVRLGMA